MQETHCVDVQVIKCRRFKAVKSFRPLLSQLCFTPKLKLTVRLLIEEESPNTQSLRCIIIEHFEPLAMLSVILQSLAPTLALERGAIRFKVCMHKFQGV